MFERGATLRAAPGPLTGLGAQLLLLAALAEWVGLGRVGWIVGITSALILDAALARALWYNPAARLGAAGWVTLARATLAVGVAALAAGSLNPVDDWSYASPGIETVRITFGRTVADLVAAAAVLTGAAALLFTTLAVLRLTRVAARHRRHSLQTLAALTAAWVVCWAFGAALDSGTSIASTSGAGLAVQEVQAVESDLRDRARFDAKIRNDRYRNTAGDPLLTGLRGKDVLLVFVESYGKLAVQGSSISPGIDAVVDAGTRQLAGAGFSARSGWLTSSTFGGGSWLAHATMQSGTWVDSQGRYNELVASNRLTLTKAFGQSGWRTVADVPSDTRDWPEGTSFYHYDQIYDRRNLGYRGPKYGFASMPDQYVLLALQRLELAKQHRRPVFSEVDLVSSHTPWVLIPPLIDWNRVGDGSIFHRLHDDESGFTDAKRGYSHSIKYTLRTLFSFIEHYGRKNLVLIVLGDHQPSRVVSYRPGHDVPISIIAHDPAVMRRIADWGWADGMLPDPNSPVWPMSAFRDRFLSAFGP